MIKLKGESCSNSMKWDHQLNWSKVGSPYEGKKERFCEKWRFRENHHLTSIGSSVDLRPRSAPKDYGFQTVLPHSGWRPIIKGLIGKLQSFPRDNERHVCYSSKEETTHLPNGSIHKHRSPMVMFPRGTWPCHLSHVSTTTFGQRVGGHHDMDNPPLLLP